MARILRRASAEISVPRDRLRLSTARVDAITRDVSVQGRIIAAVSPTLFAPADGTITLNADAGAEVEAGGEIARLDSPELESQKNVDLAQAALTAAEREWPRAELAFESRSISSTSTASARSASS